MADVNDGDIIRASARMRHQNSGDMVNVYHWKYVGTGSTTANIVTGIEGKLDAMMADVSGYLHQSNDPYDLRIDVVDNIGGKEKVVKALGTYTWTLTQPPAATGDDLPPMDSAIVNFRSTRPKSYGRKYLGSIGEAHQNQGGGTPAFITALGNYATEFLTDIGVTGGNLSASIFSIIAGDPWVLDLTAGVVQGILGSLGSRRKTVGS